MSKTIELKNGQLWLTVTKLPILLYDECGVGIGGLYLCGSEFSSAARGTLERLPLHGEYICTLKATDVAKIIKQAIERGRYIENG